MGTTDCHSAGITSALEREILLRMAQPMTATQLAGRLSQSLDACSGALRTLQQRNLIRCLNPQANKSRLYWWTPSGLEQQAELAGSSLPAHDLPDLDWSLYGSICFRQRSEVIRTLSTPMLPAKIKRLASFRKSALKLSSNNVRDVLRYLEQHGIVRRIPLPKKKHPGYELTPVGEHFRRLLLRVEVFR